MKVKGVTEWKAGGSGKQSGSNSRLPSLAFGGDLVPELRDPGLFAQELHTNWGASVQYRPVDDFRSRVAAAHMLQVPVICAATSAGDLCNMKLSAGAILIPIHGAARFRCDQRVVASQQGRTAVYLPPEVSGGECNTWSFIGIKADPQRFQAVAAAMLGERAWGGKDVCLELDRPRSLELTAGRIHFEQLFRQYMAMIDALGCDGARASRAGVDDMILRTTLMLIAPQLFFPDRESLAFEKRKLSAVFEYIDVHLAQRITLSDLEIASGLSARSLQYAFQTTAGASPMQWVTQRRLEIVRNQLLAASPVDTVTTLASGYFANLGAFSRLYHQRFGEYPSQTLQDAQAKPRRKRNTSSY